MRYNMVELFRLYQRTISSAGRTCLIELQISTITLFTNFRGRVRTITTMYWYITTAVLYVQQQQYGRSHQKRDLGDHEMRTRKITKKSKQKKEQVFLVSGAVAASAAATALFFAPPRPNKPFQPNCFT